MHSVCANNYSTLACFKVLACVKICYNLPYLQVRGRTLKTFAQNFEKLTPPPCLQNVRTGLISPLSVRTHHQFRKILSFFASNSADVRIWRTSPPLSAKSPHWTTHLLPWLRTSFMDGPLYFFFTNFTNINITYFNTFSLYQHLFEFWRT